MNILTATFDLEDYNSGLMSPNSLGFKPPEANMEFHDDPVALTCASHRTFLATGIRWTDLKDATATDQDRRQAVQIRKYYSDRILLAAIAANGEMSEFRRKLYGLLIGQTGLKKRDIGLLYRLPYFYAEDTAMDQVMEQTESANANGSGTRGTAGKFQVIRRIQVSRRSGETVQLWLQKDSSRVPYMIAAKLDNPFLTLVESVLERPTALEAVAQAKHHRGHYRSRVYYQLSDLKLIQ